MAYPCIYGCGCEPFTDKGKRLAHYKEYPGGSCVSHFNLQVISDEDEAGLDDAQGDANYSGDERGATQARQRRPPIPIETHLLQVDDDLELQYFEEDDKDPEPPTPTAQSKEEVEERLRRKFFWLAKHGNQSRGYSLGDIDKWIAFIQECYAEFGASKARLTFTSKDDYAKYTNKLLDITDDGWSTVTISVGEDEVPALKGHQPVTFEFHYKKAEQWLKEEFGNAAYKGDFALNPAVRKGADGSRCVYDCGLNMMSCKQRYMPESVSH